MGDLESCRPAFPHTGFAMVHAGLHSKQKQLHLRNQELGNELNEWKADARLVESKQEGSGKKQYIFFKIMNYEEKEIMFFLGVKMQITWNTHRGGMLDEREHMGPRGI
jgi:hypothetical protein